MKMDSKKRRVFALKAFDKNVNAVENVKKLASSLKKLQPDVETVICVPEKLEDAIKAYADAGLSVMRLPAEHDNYPKQHNAMIRAFKGRGEDIWLHMLECHVVLLEDPSKMVEDIERMMQVYD